MWRGEQTCSRGPNAVIRIHDHADLKCEQCLVQATSESTSRNIVNMLGPNKGVHVII